MSYESSPFEFDEEVDCELHKAWFVDKMHFLGVLDHFSTTWAAELLSHGFLWAADKISLPSCKGVLWRNYKGLCVIITPLVVESEAEKKEREVKFRANLPQLAKDFSPIWERYKSELLELYRPFKEFDLKKANMIELTKKMFDLRQVGFRMAEIHFYMLYASFCFFILFEDLCKELLGIDASNPELTIMLRGFDNKSFQCERELWRLSRRVIELNLRSTFDLPSQEIAPKLREGENGRKWMVELNQFLDEFGWRTETCWMQNTPSWREDPRYVIEKVKQYLKLTEHTPEEDMKKAAEERERTIAKHMARLPEDKKGVFRMFLKGAQYADLYSEEHDLYCEMQTDALLRLYALELGKRFVETGTINEVDDIFGLSQDEIRKVGLIPERWRLQSLIEKRKLRAAADIKKGIPNVVSKKGWDLPGFRPLMASVRAVKAFEWMVSSRDPIITKVIAGELPKPKPELKADLVGSPGAPGVAEGPARVVLSDGELESVQPGEILVAPTTTISWTTIFALVKGVVVDRGGILSHAAVVAREYGIPCVLNTFTGTSKIKTGQRIRVDGTQGAVHILR
jgi:pyruvate,water dikinase